MGKTNHEKHVEKIQKSIDTIISYLKNKKTRSFIASTYQNTFDYEHIIGELKKYSERIIQGKAFVNSNLDDFLEKAARLIQTHNARIKKESIYQIRIRNEYTPWIFENLEGANKKFLEQRAKYNQKHSKDPFLNWLFTVLTIHRPLKNEQGAVSKLATGDLHGVLHGLICEDPVKYTVDFERAVYDIYNRFQKERPKYTATSTLAYFDIITEPDVIVLQRVSERVRDYTHKKKPFPYKTLCAVYTKLRDCLSILIAAIIINYEIPEMIAITIAPTEINNLFRNAMGSIQQLFMRTNRRQLQQRIIDTQVDIRQQEQQPTDFSSEQLTILKKKLSQKKNKKKKSSTSSTATTTPRSEKRQQSSSSSYLLPIQQQQQQQQQQTKPSARRQRQRQQQLQFIESGVSAKDPLRQRKQENMVLLRDDVSGLAKTIMEEALSSNASCVLLVDVRNISTKRFASQSFHGKRQKLFLQSNEKLIRQQLSQNDRLDADLSNPLIVYVDQGDVEDGFQSGFVSSDDNMRMLVRVPCVKPFNGNQVDCHLKMSQTQQQQSLKNPMDDYVLLSLYSILNKYYRNRLHKEGKLVEQAFREINQFMRWNPGMARYSPDMALQFRDRMKEVRQFNKKPTSYAFIISGDMYRDWKMA